MLSVCGTWMIEWGPGSCRPDHYMPYHFNDEGDHYVGTFLTLQKAVTEAVRWEGRPLDWGSTKYGRRSQFVALSRAGLE